MKVVNTINNNCMSQHHFSYETAFIDSADACYCAQPSAPLSNLESMKYAQPIFLANSNALNTIHIGQIPNLPMLSSDSKKIKYYQTSSIFP